MKKKNFLASLILLFVCMFNAYSIGFGFHTFEIRTNPEFSLNIFPTSLLYQFDFPVPNFIPGQTTEIDFRIDNGLDFRKLRQEPTTGTPFEMISDEIIPYPTTYTTIFNEMNLVMGQGLFKTSITDKDLLKFWFTFDIRLENSYERFAYLLDENNMESLFHTSTGENRFDSWIGQPELAGDQSSSNISISLGLDINLMEEKITRRNGLKDSIWIRLNPIWFDAFRDGTQDYLLIWNKLDLAFTPFYIKMKGIRDTAWFSIVLENSTIYRYIAGSKVPYYITGDSIFGQTALNTEHLITNRTSVFLYGPQINSYDCYPYLQGFIDIGVNLGNLLNTSTTIPINSTITSIGLHAEFVIFNIANFYYEIGKVLTSFKGDEGSTIVRFGFSFGV